jgi:hypothetical protein
MEDFKIYVLYLLAMRAEKKYTTVINIWSARDVLVSIYNRDVHIEGDEALAQAEAMWTPEFQEEFRNKVVQLGMTTLQTMVDAKLEEGK